VQDRREKGFPLDRRYVDIPRRNGAVPLTPRSIAHALADLAPGQLELLQSRQCWLARDDLLAIGDDFLEQLAKRCLAIARVAQGVMTDDLGENFDVTEGIADEKRRACSWLTAGRVVRDRNVASFDLENLSSECEPPLFVAPSKGREDRTETRLVQGCETVDRGGMCLELCDCRWCEVAEDVGLDEGLRIADAEAAA
jgi:hypothetical protein